VPWACATQKKQVLVLDEATASVDNATDGMIQQTLNRHFNDSTVIIIAHRITSVLDSDMVLVLEQGSLSNFVSSCVCFHSSLDPRKFCSV
jgi:ATP-binding cassette, subfamily C (CFTR/MRP), member 2